MKGSVDGIVEASMMKVISCTHRWERLKAYKKWKVIFSNIRSPLKIFFLSSVDITAREWHTYGAQAFLRFIKKTKLIFELVGFVILNFLQIGSTICVVERFLSSYQWTSCSVHNCWLVVLDSSKLENEYKKCCWSASSLDLVNWRPLRCVDTYVI